MIRKIQFLFLNSSQSSRDGHVNTTLKHSVQKCADCLGCQEAVASSCAGVEGEGDPGRLPEGEDAWLMSEGMSSAEGQGIRKAGYFGVGEQHV